MRTKDRVGGIGPPGFGRGSRKMRVIPLGKRAIAVTTAAMVAFGLAAGPAAAHGK
jgi:hypothetical protein